VTAIGQERTLRRDITAIPHFGKLNHVASQLPVNASWGMVLFAPGVGPTSRL